MSGTCGMLPRSHGASRKSAEQMPSRVIGEQAKPRALIFGFDDAMAKRIGALFGSWKPIKDFGEVDQQEWDVVVTTRSVVQAEHHLYVIATGCDAYALGMGGQVPSAFGPFHNPAEPDNIYKGWINFTGDSRARELEVPAGLPSSITRLIETQLVPLSRQETVHRWLAPSVTSPEYDQAWENALEPFLTTRRNQCLAGRFPRPGAESECWCFPSYAVSLAPAIVEVALGEWRKRDSRTFPQSDWSNNPQWRTPTENRITGELDELQAKRQAVLRQLGEAQERLETELLEAKRNAEGRERLLLTGQRDDLVGVTIDCLSDLGFGVTNMDEIYPAGELREDLQVTTPEVPDWIALVEVRGYRRGAQTTDLQRIERFRRRYLRDNGRDADAAWYIVNQFNTGDPGTRPPVLVSNEDDLALFADDNGLAIDTTDLFRLWMAVKDGRVTSEQARPLLVGKRGRFEFKS